jgi:hypothetical protein
MWSSLSLQAVGKRLEGAVMLIFGGNFLGNAF